MKWPSDEAYLFLKFINCWIQLGKEITSCVIMIGKNMLIRISVPQGHENWDCLFPGELILMICAASGVSVLIFWLKSIIRSSAEAADTRQSCKIHQPTNIRQDALKRHESSVFKVTNPDNKTQAFSLKTSKATVLIYLSDGKRSWWKLCALLPFICSLNNSVMY